MGWEFAAACFVYDDTYIPSSESESSVCHDCEMLNGAICMRELLSWMLFGLFIYFCACFHGAEHLLTGSRCSLLEDNISL